MLMVIKQNKNRSRNRRSSSERSTLSLQNGLRCYRPLQNFPLVAFLVAAMQASEQRNKYKRAGTDAE